MPSISMYADLIQAALGEVTAGEGQLSPDQALAEVVRRRPMAVPGGWPDTGWPPVWEALAGQVAYDVALIRLARAHGVECEPRKFGSPGDERQKVERALMSGGVHLR